VMRKCNSVAFSGLVLSASAPVMGKETGTTVVGFPVFGWSRSEEACRSD